MPAPADAGPDHPRGTHPKTISDSGLHFMDSSPDTVLNEFFVSGT